MFSFCESFSQEKKLLQQYTFRIDRYKAINFGLGANGRKDNNYNFSSNNAAALSGSFNINYFTIKSTDKLLQNISAGLASSATSFNNTTYTTTNKLKDFNILPSFSINNKWYAKNNFVELGANFGDVFSTSHANDDRVIMQERLSNNNFINASIGLGIGKGRLENITDMQNAIWLHNILLKEDNIKRKLAEEEIIEFARTLTMANNRRVLDGRKRIQFILKSVDSYLQTKEVIGKTDINYFSNLNDIVFFANNFPRQAGKEKYIRLIPSLANYTRKDESRIIPISKSTQSENGAEIVLKIGLQNFKPLNLIHQMDYGVALKTNYGKSTNRFKRYTNSNVDYSFDFADEWKKIGVDYFVRYSIFPNTRTVIEFDLKAENGYQSLNAVDELYHTVALAANASYFISYNTRLNINFGTTYNKYNYDIRAINRYSPSNLDDNNLAMFFNTTLNIAL